MGGGVIIPRDDAGQEHFPGVVQDLQGEGGSFVYKTSVTIVKWVWKSILNIRITLIIV